MAQWICPPYVNRKKRSRKNERGLPQDYAYLYGLRNYDSSRRVYDENPYAEVYTFRDNIYGILEQSINGGRDLWLWLIDGPERAMLIDTGAGLGNLNKLISAIIGDKPLIVVNSCAKYAHVLGNFNFERVYCGERDVQAVNSFIRDDVYSKLLDKNGNGFWADFDPADLVPVQNYEIIGVPDGYIFDLGGSYQVEVIALPGPTKGHIGFIDHGQHILFAGLAAGGTEIADDCTVRMMRDALVDARKRSDQFDKIFTSHGVTDILAKRLDDVIGAYTKIVDDPDGACRKMLIEKDGTVNTKYVGVLRQSDSIQFSAGSV